MALVHRRWFCLSDSNYFEVVWSAIAWYSSDFFGRTETIRTGEQESKKPVQQHQLLRRNLFI